MNNESTNVGSSHDLHSFNGSDEQADNSLQEAQKKARIIWEYQPPPELHDNGNGSKTGVFHNQTSEKARRLRADIERVAVARTTS